VLLAYGAKVRNNAKQAIYPLCLTQSVPLTREIDQFLSEKRAHKQAKRRLKLWHEELERRASRERRHAAFGDRSRIIKMISEGYDKDPSIQKSKLDIAVPAKFSIIEAPETALAAVCTFARGIRKHRVQSVRISHRNMALYDLAANGLLDVVAVELKAEASHTSRRIRWEGQFPKDRNVQRFIRSLGIIKHLGVAHEYAKPEEVTDLHVFDHRNRHYYRTPRPQRADHKTQIVSAFSDHIDDCLQAAGRQLTPEARHKLCAYTGEILDNVEEHAEFVDWTIQGYLDNSLSIPICEIAIFNFGLTIAETIRVLPRDSYTWTQVAPYMTHHRNHRWFGPDWAENDLLTLIALQGHVSSKNKSAQDTRGNGTVDLIEFFQQVHLECSRESEVKATMAIVSGSTHILFDGTYRLQERPQGPRVIAFNKTNDLNDQPDHKFVRGLRGLSFPGTIISIRFPLSRTRTMAIEGR